ncbi:MAG: HTH-type transcriptional activator IlvY [Pseudomonadales bacterium]|nr:HTH-type transcriptional activator IlvY [Pseudomonadales bacterium]
MNPKELELFLHLAKSLHFAGTSAACHVSPSSLTRTIRKIEDEVGKPLFERDNRRVSLTQAGQEFRDYADKALSDWIAVKHSLARQDKLLQGEISLYCSVTASYSFLYELLSRFRSEHPGIEIKLHTGDTAATISRILGEHEDIGIAAIPERYPANLAVQTITQTPLVFIRPRQDSHFSQMLKEEGAIDWGRVPMILSEAGLARERVDAWFRYKKVKPDIYAQVSGNEAIVSMVSLGFGVGVVPRLVLENSPLQDRIEIQDISPGLEPFAIGMCSLRRKMLNPLVRAFWDIASASIAGSRQN